MNMKRICCIISLFVLCLTFNRAHAQRCLPGMKGLQVTGGMADGVHWNNKSDFAYYFGAALSTYTKNGNRWVIGGEYLEKHYPYKDLQIPVSQFTGEGGYSLTDKDGFVYGGALTLELESYITDRVVFLINARERCLFGSSVGKFHTQFGIGLKIIM